MLDRLEAGGCGREQRVLCDALSELVAPQRAAAVAAEYGSLGAIMEALRARWEYQLEAPGWQGGAGACLWSGGSRGLQHVRPGSPIHSRVASQGSSNPRFIRPPAPASPLLPNAPPVSCSTTTSCPYYAA